jgi:hypothetical protein
MLPPEPVKAVLFTGNISGYHSDVFEDSNLIRSYVIDSTGRQSSTFVSIVAVQLQGYTFQDHWPQLRSGKCTFCMVKYDAIITWTFALNMHVITRMYHKYI